jgi:lipopolysaccharide export system protein LptC
MNPPTPALANPAAARTAARRQGWSQTVGLLKILLPAVALSLVALVIVWAQLRNSDPGFRIGFSLVKPEDARQLSMVNARYAGRNKNKQPYLVTATTAVQETAKADKIRLQSPKGDMTMSGGAWVALSAPEGDYHQSTQILDLRNGVNLFHDSGMEFNTQTARINLKDSTAFGNDPVTGHGPATDIKSKGFRILDSGKRVIFTGKAQLTLYRKKETPAKPKRASTGGKK